jgi:malonyl-CoA O-methyltransferase
MRDKQKIAQTFGQAAALYQAHASLQRDCAAKLLTLLDGVGTQWQMPSGQILEVGCGTGFLTQGLCDRFPQQPLLATDLSAEMIAFCQQQLSQRRTGAIAFQQMDGEQITGRYSLIVASFVIQWFQDPATTLQHWLKCLEPNGVLCLAFPSDGSFPEWRQACQALQIPFTANSLPNVKKITHALSPYSQNYVLQEEIFATHHTNGSDFLRGLKAIGTGVNTSGKQLSSGQMKQLMAYWHEPLQMHHAVAFLVMQRSLTTRKI